MCGDGTHPAEDELRDLLDEMDQIIERQRVYASFRELGPKGLKELDVVRDLLKSLPGGTEYDDVMSAPTDPPDCIARSRGGGRVAIEVTEFVSEEAVRLNEAARSELERRPDIAEMVLAEWSEEALVGHLSDRMADKDRKTLNGGPFDEYLVVFHTDEPLLVWTTVEGWLATQVFGPFEQITSAYMLFSYHPEVGYPLVPLQIRQQ